MKISTIEIEKLSTWLFSIHSVEETRKILTTFLLKLEIIDREEQSFFCKEDRVPTHLYSKFQTALTQFLEADEQTLQYRNLLFLLAKENAKSLEALPLPEENQFFRDLRGVSCPTNLIKAKTELKKIPPGAPLLLWLDKGQPLENVPRGLRSEGFVIQKLQPYENFGSLLLRNHR